MVEPVSQGSIHSTDTDRSEGALTSDPRKSLKLAAQSAGEGDSGSLLSNDGDAKTTGDDEMHSYFR